MASVAKSSPPLARVRELLGLLARRRVVGTRLDQDVARATPLGRNVALGRHLRVKLAQRVLGHFDAGLDVRQVEAHVLQVHGFRRAEVRGVLFVPGRDLLGRDLGAGRKSRGGQHRILDVARLALESDATVELAWQRECGDANAIAELRDLEVAAEIVLELRLGAALRAQHRGIAIAGEAAIHLQRGNFGNGLDQVRVTDAEARLGRALHQQFAANEVLQQPLLLGLDQRLRQFVAQHLLQLVLAILPGALHRLHRDLLTVDLGGRGGHGGLELDAPENEDNGDCTEEDGGEPAGDLVANLLQHWVRGWG